MKRKTLKLSFFTVLTFLIFINITDTTNAQEMPVPDKTEFIEVDNEIIPVFHFDDPNEADLHRVKWAEANQEIFEIVNSDIGNISGDNQIGTEISPMAATTYTYKSYAGTAPYKYNFNVYENRTNKVLKLTREVTNKVSTSATVSVSLTFKSFFKSKVGLGYANNKDFKDKFKLEIPKNKQGEIWTWNYAGKYNFSQKKNGKTTNFTVWRPTENFGSAVYYLNFRDPS